MIKHFVIVFVTVFTLLAALPDAALARAQQGVAPAAMPADTADWIGESGTASFYGAAHHGRRAADGGRFNQMALTAAHPWLPFGTKVLVTLASTGRTVIVTITDRLYSKRRIVDLSFAAARRIGMVDQGIGEVTLLPG